MLGVGGVAAAGLALGAAAPAAACRVAVMPPTPTGLDPARTWVLSIGVLAFARHDLFDSFPVEGRRDDVLCDTLARRGVPASQITRLRDAAATRAEILRLLGEVAARVPAGHDLVLYYAGHGVQDEDGTTYFTATDSGDDNARTCVSHTAVLDALDASFRGRNVLVFADCCYSGAFPALLARRAAARPYAALASSLASEISTGHWTFTDALIAAFSGEPRVDVGHDGRVTLGELARFAEEEMAFAEGQLAPFHASGQLHGLELGPASPLPFPRYGERVLARWRRRWWPARILALEPEGLRVRYVGYDASDDEVVRAEDVRPYAPEERAVGARAEVRWRGRWYPATVLASRLGVHRVHYEGFADSWDEWVSRERIRDVRGASRRAR